MHQSSSRSHRTAITFVIAALLLSGCSSNTSIEAPDSQQTDGPLSKYLSAIYGEKALSEESSRKEFQERETNIASCMKKKGFAYTPSQEPEGGSIQPRLAEDEPAYGSLQYAKEYGFGLASSPEDAEPRSEGTPQADPNEVSYRALSPSEQQAYDLALHGTTLHGTTPDENGTPMPAESKVGCAESAVSAQMKDAEKVHELFEDPEFVGLKEAIDTFQDKPISPQKMAALNVKWRDCVEEAGVESATDPDELRNRWQEDFNHLFDKEDGDDMMVELSDSDRRVFQDKEIHAATIDWQCQDKTKYQQTIRSLTNDAEQKFVDEHKKQLDAFAARYETQEQ